MKFDENKNASTALESAKVVYCVDKYDNFSIPKSTKDCKYLDLLVCYGKNSKLQSYGERLNLSFNDFSAWFDPENIPHFELTKDNMSKADEAKDDFGWYKMAVYTDNHKVNEKCTAVTGIVLDVDAVFNTKEAMERIRGMEKQLSVLKRRKADKQVITELESEIDAYKIKHSKKHSFDEISASLEKYPYKAVIHTTSSNWKNTRFRINIVFNRTLRLDEFETKQEFDNAYKKLIMLAVEELRKLEDENNYFKIDPAMDRLAQMSYRVNNLGDGYRKIESNSDFIDIDMELDKSIKSELWSKEYIVPGEEKEHFNMHDCKGIKGAINRNNDLCELLEESGMYTQVYGDRWIYVYSNTKSPGGLYADKTSSFWSFHGDDPYQGIKMGAFEIVRFYMLGADPEVKGDKYQDTVDWFCVNRPCEEYGEYLPRFDQEIYKGIIQKTIDSMVNKFALKITHGIYQNDRGYNIDVRCPYCSEIDPFGETGNEYTFTIYEAENGNIRLSAWGHNKDCRNEQHKQHNQKILDFFNKIMPNKSYFESLMYIAELKRYFTGKSDKRFFQENTQVLVGTGGGKTYQCAMKIIECVIDLDFVIFSTKENAMLHDIQGELEKIITLHCKQTHTIKSLLDSKEVLKKLGLYKMTATSSLSESQLPYINGIVTNHKYWSIVGDKAGNNNKMQKVIDYLNLEKKTPIILIDEFEDFENKSRSDILLNKWLIEDTDINGCGKVFEKTDNCFNAKAGIKKDHSPYDWATRINKHTSGKDEKSIEAYRISEHGDINLERDLEMCIKSVRPPRYDYGRRVNKSIEGEQKQEIEFILTGKYETIIIDKTRLESKKERNNIEQLLLSAQGACFAEYVLEIGIKDSDKTVLSSPQEINKWVEANNISLESYKTLKHALEVEAGKKLFNRSLIIKQKSCLTDINKSIVYRLSANSANCDMQVNDDLVYKSANGIKKELFFWIPRDRDEDNVIKRIHEQLECINCKQINPLIFYGLKDKLNRYYAAAKSHNAMTRTTYITNSLDDSDITPKTTDKTTDVTVEKYTTATYLNGSESQGKNYSSTELLILNAKVPIDFKGRLYWNDSLQEFICEDIQSAAIKKLTQASGRVDRVEIGKKDITKVVILVGGGKEEDEEAQALINAFVDKKSKYPYDTELIVQPNIKLPRKDKPSKEIERLIDYITSILDKNNRGTDRNINPNLLKDGRAKGNNKKYNDDEICKLYHEETRKLFLSTRKKVKKTDVFPILQAKYGVAKATLKRIISKNQKT